MFGNRKYKRISFLCQMVSYTLFTLHYFEFTLLISEETNFLLFCNHYGQTTSYTTIKRKIPCVSKYFKNKHHIKNKVVKNYNFVSTMQTRQVIY